MEHEISTLLSVATAVANCPHTYSTVYTIPPAACVIHTPATLDARLWKLTHHPHS